MLQTYHFIYDPPPLSFDDTQSVKSLLAYAFDHFDYYEPAGLEIVTIFQPHHSQSNCGWFTTDTSRTCAEEIESPEHLCFAYHLLECFYFAEGGWGHHMPELGNHPSIPDPVLLPLRFEDFNNSVVINGNLTFRDVISYLQRYDYIPTGCDLYVKPVGITAGPYRVSRSDRLLGIPLKEFEAEIDVMGKKMYPGDGYIYHNIFELR